MPDKIAKFIKSLDGKTRLRLKRRLLRLKKDPFGYGQDVKKLRSAEGDLYRLRIGKLRIIYRVAEREVEIMDIDYRGNIY